MVGAAGSADRRAAAGGGGRGAKMHIDPVDTIALYKRETTAPAPTNTNHTSILLAEIFRRLAAGAAGREPPSPRLQRRHHPVLLSHYNTILQYGTGTSGIAFFSATAAV